MSNDISTRKLMPGLHFTSDGRAWSLKIDSINVLRNALGDDLTVAFVRCLGVVDKLRTILDCMYLNNEHAGGNVDSVRSLRNLHVLGMFAAGLVFECREGVAAIRDANIVGRLSPGGLQRWRDLEQVANLQHEDVLRQIRNCMAFHLGDPAIVREGLKNLSADERAPGFVPDESLSLVIRGDSERRIDTEHPISVNVIGAGIAVRPHNVPAGTPNGRRRMQVPQDLEDGLTEASSRHFQIVRLVDELFLDCLRHAGADLNPLDALDDETPEVE